jgi:predicted PurR-regulated permease PerM
MPFAEVRLQRSLVFMSPRSTDQIRLALMWGGLALLLYCVYLIVTPFLVPLGWAAVLAVIAYPTHERLAARWGAGRAAAASTAAVTVILIFPTVALAFAFVREAVAIGEAIQRALAEGRFAWVERTWSELGRRLPFAGNLDVSALAADGIRGGAGLLVAQSGAVFRNTAGFLLNLAISLFSMFFLLRDAPAIMRAIRRLLPMDERAREDMIARTRELISAAVTSSGLVAAAQGFLGGIAFALVGIEAPVFWGVVMAFFCLLPLGAAIIWVPAAIVLAVGGHTTRALILAGLGAGIISMVDNVLRPMLLSGRANMNGLVILVSLLGGLSVFGLLGLVLGPIVVVTALALLENYINEPSEPA